MTTPLIVGGVGVLLGLFLLKDFPAPDPYDASKAGKYHLINHEIAAANRAAQARSVVASDPGADSYFAARVKNSNLREAQKARLEKWKASL